MSQKSSVPQAVSFVSQVLKRDKRLELDPGSIADQHREVSGGPCSRRMMFAPCAVAAVL
jgi:hypothetical protein